eukprot:SAG11_NODE_7774_length_1097_cov_1.713427_1_plen_93_part_00
MENLTSISSTNSPALLSFEYLSEEAAREILIHSWLVVKIEISTRLLAVCQSKNRNLLLSTHFVHRQKASSREVARDVNCIAMDVTCEKNDNF